MTKSVVLFLIPTALVLSCGDHAKQERSTKEVEMLTGSWALHVIDTGAVHQAARVMREEWTKQDDSTLRGRTYMVENNDTIVIETARLHDSAGRLVYEALAFGENNNQPVTFPRADSGSRVFTFFNGAHDFPQQIRYRQESEDSLTAEVEGQVEGRLQRMVIGMKRIRR